MTFLCSWSLLDCFSFLFYQPIFLFPLLSRRLPSTFQPIASNFFFRFPLTFLLLNKLSSSYHFQSFAVFHIYIFLSFYFFYFSFPSSRLNSWHISYSFFPSSFLLRLIFFLYITSPILSSFQLLPSSSSSSRCLSSFIFLLIFRLSWSPLTFPPVFYSFLLSSFPTPAFYSLSSTIPSS